MKRKYKFNRQFYDYLLTDLLPYEKGNHYTHVYLYKFIMENNGGIKKSINKLMRSDVYFDNNWSSAPFNFLVTKTEDSQRELSFINPLGLIQSLYFIKVFEDDIISIIQNKKDFST